MTTAPSGIWISDTVISVKTWFMKDQDFGLREEITLWLMEHTPGWFLYDSTDMPLPRLISFSNSYHASIFSETWDSKVVDYYIAHPKEITSDMVIKCLDTIKEMEHSLKKSGHLERP